LEYMQASGATAGQTVGEYILAPTSAAEAAECE